MFVLSGSRQITDLHLDQTISVSPAVLQIGSVHPVCVVLTLNCKVITASHEDSRMWENGVTAPLSLTLGTTWSASRLGRFNPRENSLIFHWVSGAVWAFLRETFFSHLGIEPRFFYCPVRGFITMHSFLYVCTAYLLTN